MIKSAQLLGYKITLLFIWLDSPDTAKRRVEDRVSKGGHNILPEVIERRYYRGISNLFKLYMPICDIWMIVNNKDVFPELIARGGFSNENMLLNKYIWDTILDQSKENGN